MEDELKNRIVLKEKKSSIRIPKLKLPTSNNNNNNSSKPNSSSSARRHVPKRPDKDCKAASARKVSFSARVIKSKEATPPLSFLSSSRDNKYQSNVMIKPTRHDLLSHAQSYQTFSERIEQAIKDSSESLDTSSFIYLSPTDPVNNPYYSLTLSTNSSNITLSSAGITRFSDDNEDDEFTTIEAYEREHYLYTLLRQLSFFKRYRAWKQFNIWKKSVSTKRIRHCQKVLRLTLLPCIHSTLSLALLKISTECQLLLTQISLYPLKNNSMTLSQYSSDAQNAFEKSARVIEEYYTVCRNITLDACSSFLETYLQDNGFTTTSNNHSSYTERASVRTQCRMLTKFIRNIDFKINATLVATGVTNVSNYALPSFNVEVLMPSLDLSPSYSVFRNRIESILFNGISVLVRRKKFVTLKEFTSFVILEEEAEEEEDLELVIVDDEGFQDSIERVNAVIKNAYDSATLRVSSTYVELLDQYRLNCAYLETSNNNTTSLPVLRNDEEEDIVENCRTVIETYDEFGRFYSTLEDHIMTEGLLLLDATCVNATLLPSPVAVLQHVCTSVIPSIITSLNTLLTDRYNYYASHFCNTNSTNSSIKHFTKSVCVLEEYYSESSALSDNYSTLSSLYSVVDERPNLIKLSDLQKSHGLMISSSRHEVEVAILDFERRKDDTIVSFQKILRKNLFPELQRDVKQLMTDVRLAADLYDYNNDNNSIMSLSLERQATVSQLQSNFTTEMKTLVQRHETLLSYESILVLKDIVNTTSTDNNSDSIRELQQIVLGLSTMWNHILKLVRVSKVWLKTAISQLDTEEALGIIKECKETMNDNVISASEINIAFQNSIETLSRVLPIVVALNNPHLHARHWNNALRISKEEVLSTTLLDFINKTEIENVLVISRDASIEASVTKKLNDIIKCYDSLCIDINPTSFQLENTCEILRVLDDHLKTLEEMEFTVTGLLHVLLEETLDRILSWKNHVMKMEKIIKGDWIPMQELYEKLLPIINSCSYMIPTDVTMFTLLDGSYKEFLKKMMVLGTEVYNVCFNEEFQTQDTLSKYLMTLRKVHDSVTTVVFEHKRKIAPRMYFLSTTEMFEVMRKDRGGLLYTISRMFNGVSSVLREEESNTITGLQGLSNDSIEFLTPVVCKEEEEELVIVNIEQAMASTLKALISVVSEESNNLPLQVQVLKSRLEFTKDTEEELRQCASSDYNRLRVYYQQIVQRIRERINSNSKNEALMTLDIHYRDTVKSMMKNECDRANSFDWIKQMRFYLQEDDTVIMKQMYCTVPYGYEYSATTSSIVITPLVEKCWVALTMAIGNGIYGESSVSYYKTSCLASALGKQCIVVDDNASSSLVLKGVVLSQCWAYIKNMSLKAVRDFVSSITTDSVILNQPTFGSYMIVVQHDLKRTTTNDSVTLPLDIQLIAEVMLLRNNSTLSDAASDAQKIYKVLSTNTSSSSISSFTVSRIIDTYCRDKKNLCRALDAVLLPGLRKDELKVYHNVMTTVFPLYDNDTISDSTSSIVKAECEKLGILSPSLEFMSKVEGLRQCVFHNTHNIPVIVTGPPMGGKTSVIKVVASLLQKDIVYNTTSTSDNTLKVLDTDTQQQHGGGGGFDVIETSRMENRKDDLGIVIYVDTLQWSDILSTKLRLCKFKSRIVAMMSVLLSVENSSNALVLKCVDMILHLINSNDESVSVRDVEHYVIFSFVWSFGMQVGSSISDREEFDMVIQDVLVEKLGIEFYLPMSVSTLYEVTFENKKFIPWTAAAALENTTTSIMGEVFVPTVTTIALASVCNEILNSGNSVCIKSNTTTGKTIIARYIIMMKDKSDTILFIDDLAMDVVDDELRYNLEHDEKNYLATSRRNTNSSTNRIQRHFHTLWKECPNAQALFQIYNTILRHSTVVEKVLSVYHKLSASGSACLTMRHVSRVIYGLLQRGIEFVNYEMTRVFRVECNDDGGESLFDSLVLPKDENKKYYIPNAPHSQYDTLSRAEFKDRVMGKPIMFDAIASVARVITTSNSSITGMHCRILSSNTAADVVLVHAATSLVNVALVKDLNEAIRIAGISDKPVVVVINEQEEASFVVLSDSRCGFLKTQKFFDDVMALRKTLKTKMIDECNKSFSIADVCEEFDERVARNLHLVFLCNEFALRFTTLIDTKSSDIEELQLLATEYTTNDEIMLLVNVHQAAVQVIGNSSYNSFMRFLSLVEKLRVQTSDRIKALENGIKKKSHYFTERWKERIVELSNSERSIILTAAVVAYGAEYSQDTRKQEFLPAFQKVLGMSDTSSITTTDSTEILKLVQNYGKIFIIIDPSGVALSYLKSLNYKVLYDTITTEEEDDKVLIIITSDDDIKYDKIFSSNRKFPVYYITTQRNLKSDDMVIVVDFSLSHDSICEEVQKVDLQLNRPLVYEKLVTMEQSITSDRKRLEEIEEDLLKNNCSNDTDDLSSKAVVIATRIEKNSLEIKTIEPLMSLNEFAVSLYKTIDMSLESYKEILLLGSNNNDLLVKSVFEKKNFSRISYLGFILKVAYINRQDDQLRNITNVLESLSSCSTKEKSSIILSHDSNTLAKALLEEHHAHQHPIDIVRRVLRETVGINCTRLSCLKDYFLCALNTLSASTLDCRILVGLCYYHALYCYSTTYDDDSSLLYTAHRVLSNTIITSGDDDVIPWTDIQSSIRTVYNTSKTSTMIFNQTVLLGNVIRFSKDYVIDNEITNNNINSIIETVEQTWPRKDEEEFEEDDITKDQILAELVTYLNTNRCSYDSE